MSEISSSGTESPKVVLQIEEHYVICNLFPGAGPSKFTTFLEKLSNGDWRIVHEHKSAWGSTMLVTPFRKADMIRLQTILSKIQL